MINTTEVLARATLAKIQARRNLSAFIHLTMPSYQANWHHDLICEKLNEVTLGDKKRVMLFVPPQHGKSTISSINFPAWSLGVDPTLKVGVCSYSADLASKFNRQTQMVIESPAYREIFPHTHLSSKNVSTVAQGSHLRNSDIFEVVGKGGFYKSVGVGGSLTGTPLDLGIIDDPFKDRMEADSARIRNRVWDWYTDVFLSRMHNGSKQVLLFTRWHEDDLAGRLLASEPEKWEIITLPAICEEIKPEDPRKIGEALWESKHSAERILAQKKRNPRTFASLYQQRPAPLEGGLLKRDWFVIERPNMERLNWNVLVDGAYTKNTANDPTALMCYAVHKGILYVKDCTAQWIESADLPQFVESFAIKNGVTRRGKISVEPKASGKTIVQVLRKIGKFNVEEYKFPKVSGLSGISSKEEKGTAIANYLRTGNIRLIPDAWNDELIAECIVFPNGKHDDRFDCLCMAAVEAMFDGHSTRQMKIHN